MKKTKIGLKKSWKSQNTSGQLELGKKIITCDEMLHTTRIYSIGADE